jgi:hypothetical protein
MLQGARVLVASEPVPAVALSLLCAHALECTLKAYLSRSGDDSRLTGGPRLRHNLTALWSLAETEGLEVPTPAPDWLATLSGLHNKPYYLRYSTGVNGLVLPKPEPMVEGVSVLLAVVNRRIVSPGT